MTRSAGRDGRHPAADFESGLEWARDGPRLSRVPAPCITRHRLIVAFGQVALGSQWAAAINAPGPRGRLLDRSCGSSYDCGLLELE